MPQISRNDLCPCGSGLKYKKCCEHRKRGAKPVAAVNAKPRNNWVSYLVLPLIILVSIAAYSNSFKVPFVFDDGAHIVNNRGVQFDDLTPIRFERLKEAIKEKGRAAAEVSFAFNYYMGKLDTYGYHLFNLIVHILTALTVYAFIKNTLTLKLPGGMVSPGQASYEKIACQVALGTALLFTAHPVNSQAVTYIVQRMTSMATLFFITAMLAYIRGRKSHSKFAAFLWYAACFVSFLLALNSKQNAVTLPFFILLYEIYFFQCLDWKRIRKNPLFITLFFAVIAAILGIALLSTGGKLFTHIFVEGYKSRPFTMGQRALTQLRVVTYYLSLLFYPHPSRLNLDYDFDLSYSLINPLSTLPCFFLIFGLIGLGFYLMKRRPVISFCIFWFFGNLVIESSIYPLDLVYEHRLYLPFLGFFWAVLTIIIKGIDRLTVSKAGRMAVKLAGLMYVVSLFNYWTYQRNDVWKSVISILEDVTAKSPKNSRQHVNLGVAYSAENQLDKAIVCYKKGIELDPNYPETYNNLGNAYNRKGMLDEAIAEYQKAIQMRYKYKEAHNNLGSAYYKKGMYDEAIAEHRIALQIQDDCEKSLNNLGVAYSAKRMYPEAIAAFKKAIEVKPDFDKPYVNLSLTYTVMGKPREAIEMLDKVKYLDPNNPSLYYNMGNAYSDMGELQKAADAFRIAIRLQPNYPAAHNNLGLALRQLGKEDEAIAAYQEAIRQNPQQAEFYYNLGLIYAGRKQHQQAIELYQKSVRYNPNIDRVHFDFALSWEAVGQYQDAVKEYEQTLKLSPGFIQAYQNLGRIYLEKLSDSNRANFYFQRAAYVSKLQNQQTNR
ncbi:MAG: tetratricopeptide repeat protein [Candidatus Schekmanbacteria bacterium]|nr:tetratricopeptide repeat protein [Candidatus Schekmanbacteria bacterium]